MSELSLAINNEIDNLKTLIMRKKKGKVQKIFLTLLSKVDENNKTEFFDLLGELLRYNCNFFTMYGYNPLLPKIKKYFTAEQFLEMEEYIINNFCLGIGEKILLAFNGEIVLHEDKIIGNIFLTNKRIIATGELEEKTGSFVPFGGLIGAIGLRVREARRKHIRGALGQSMGGKEILFFGHQVPINEAFEIQKKSKNIRYFVNLEERQEKKIKIRKLKVKIVPKKMKKESSKEFDARRDEILNTIENNL